MFIVVSSKNYNVLSYGAVGNGNNDDTQAFIKAWTDTCKDSDRPVMLIPKGKTFLVHPVTFAGPCKSSQVDVQLSGNVIAPNDPNAWKGLDFGKWLTFQYVDGLTVSGDGLLDGRGKGWWDISCKYNPGKGCNKLAPSILRFENCNNVKTTRIRTVQSGGVHLVYFGCQGVEVTSVNINAPDESPNTDGIRLSHSTSVSITDSIIGTGDDCIAMLDRSYNISITRVNCGPGHGISIGSLGGNGDEVDLENITISHINFYNTTNGARIKTWPAGKGQVRNVEFSNIKFKEVENPIIIDQHYGESKNSPRQKTEF
ncbi:probable polygalacturonase At3g15720 [Manihot esculenta]|uniref:Uncharacterized protein n=1 Tax=Manihot esculenta TaxID=3983 RepID=A0ACB7GTT6_MANES|nr:probable polygalacturonase At3g15720 [Manihot esculenta]KAG8643630.1 hypothetical protein MANES_11G054800v8 [Manihot esculenta]